jgi:putative peptidoglycan lipid II flippase
MAAMAASRLMGLVREAVLGRTLAASATADVYQAAFIIPDWLNYTLAGGALSIVFIPIFGAYLDRGEEERGWEAFSVIANFLLGLLALATTALWLLTPGIVDFAFDEFDAGQRAELVRLTRIILPAQVLHILGGLLSASLQARDRHAVPAFAPLLYTGSIALGGAITGTADGFAWGVVVGSALGPFGLPLVACLRTGLTWRGLVRLDHPDLRAYLWRALPIMLAFSVVMVDDAIYKWLATAMDEGAVALTSYAKSLMRVPIGVFGMAIGAATFPTLTRLVGEGAQGDARKTMFQAVARISILAAFSQVVLTSAGPEISRVVYGGRISPAQHELVGTTLSLMCLGLWAWSTQTMLSRGFYAVQKTWLPSLVGTLAFVVCLPAYIYLGHRFGPPGLGGAGALAITIYTLALGFLLGPHALGRASADEASYVGLAARLVPAVLVGLAAGFGVDRLLVDPFWFDWSALARPLLRGFLVGGAGGLAFVAITFLLQVPEAHDLLASLRRRFRRQPAAESGAGR